MSALKEKDLEQKLVQAVHERGGQAFKFVSPGAAGVPDRLLLFPRKKIAFCEVKAPGKKIRPLQSYRIIQLRKLGFRVYVLDNEEMIGEMLNEICPS